MLKSRTTVNFLTRLGTLLKKRRWLLMFIFGVIVIGFEAMEHISEQDSLLTAHFVREVLLYGIVIPLSVAILLSLVERAEMTRDTLATQLEHRQEFSIKLRSAANLEQLVQLIVGLPSTILPATSSSLLIEKPDNTGLALAAAWPPGGAAIPTSTIGLDHCQYCVLHASPISQLHQCPRQVEGEPDQRYYCLPLSYQESIIGLLTFSVPANYTVSAQQREALVNFTPEMALSLENARLQNLVETQSAASEAERERIARDLHDTLGQNISYLRLKLEQISGKNSLMSIAEIEQDLARMRDTANEAYLQMRGTLAQLQPSAQFDLEKALRTHAGKVSARAGFQVEITSRGKSLPLFPQVKREALYICREALNNIERHAKATTVKIELLWSAQDLSITIVDDGIGFNPLYVDTTGHYGLSIMSERAHGINARLSLDSQPGQGTKISLWIPVLAAQVVEQI